MLYTLVFDLIFILIVYTLAFGLILIPILGFHPRDPPLGNGCYPSCWCPSSVNKPSSKRREGAIVEMVLCVVVGCGRKSGKRNTQGFFRIPSVVKHQGEEFEDLTTERRNSWISAISRGDTDTKNVLESERVCERHFVSGRPSPNWDKFNVDWIPTLNLGKRIHKQKDVEAATKKAERAKARNPKQQVWTKYRQDFYVIVLI